jgi:NADPH-dependent 2,4-dienoyl-CoA reductase/sulfur reductase-like enzyme
MDEATYLIIGNGVAGVTAAQEIRRADSQSRYPQGHDPQGRILMISDEGEPYYYRASLSEWISGQNAADALPGRTTEFYNLMHIEQMAAHVARIEPDARQAILADGRSIGYEKLLIATGARSNVYPVEGLEETLTFRSLADARAIKAQAERCERALIVGGGILGLELAGALKKLGLARIAVVQRTPPLGKPLLDAQAAEWLQAYMAADGTDVFVGDTVERVAAHTAYLKSDRTWPFDVFVQTVGITPVFPEVPGLAVGKGIRIDEQCRTNLPHIYAAGDCTETRVPGTEHEGAPRWQTTRIWLDCARQAKVAGCNMANQNATLTTEPFFNASVIYTLFYTFIGEPHGEGQVHIWRGDDAAGSHGYRKFRVVDGKLFGALLLGQRHGQLAIHRAIGQPVAQFGVDIARPDFSWNDLTGQDWDYYFY